ncbi:unnamed protein product [Vitrella brassicaformis CCMP3155]|uniref:TLDc domain-containing protein n=1 Tax=Vitrella brassicaformis (strain CCMP3155) TaxID=1169540 RepID=A0A0G4EW95_VITBC|nr:unnamed protein product [Vitrella brassicaformis CCMP3155]|eukprot:CEM02728.1 unnamed protein product [Vitrella brassicaformis CCMP3155]
MSLSRWCLAPSHRRWLRLEEARQQIPQLESTMASGSHADEAPIASPVEPQHSPTRDSESAAAGVLGLTDEQQDALRGWVDGRQLRLLYRASCDGSRYEDLLRCVRDAGPLVFVIRKDDYVFGGYMGDGLKLPEDPRGFDSYSSDLWHFSLAGHFDGPTKIKLLHTWEKRADDVHVLSLSQ